MASSVAEEEPVLPQDPLDQEIALLKRQVASLRKRLQVECSTILSAGVTQDMIESDAATSYNDNSPRKKLAKRSSQQQAYIQQCAYRISTSVTAFKIHDPDPNAVDEGRVLGVRFEIMSAGQFLRPYYVMLNRPFERSRLLRVHRHTIPPAIPLSGLAARHLPPPKKGHGGREPKQDLDMFVKRLRREIMRHHNRLGVTADLRQSARVNEQARSDAETPAIIDVGVADVEAKQIRLTWADDRTGRIVMDDDGKVLKFAIFGPDGRDWETAKALLGSHDRVEDIVELLEQSE
ncbi:hypothetical protein VHEMI06997 [[Torrubiella] hemipterigena]|uniref:Cenp-O kinetochore centromere component n=1 Tax=[Torrubiella] hemipterigena TaxID=1531966 RepID=A0A0A1TKH3_9HYPO|nr:hypothetical protein VHEMI06997 [[Torrubiella] hemipterigena]